MSESFHCSNSAQNAKAGNSSAGTTHFSQHLFGYARVSTDDQNLSLQIDALTMQGIHKQHIFMDKVSGAKTERPGLSKCLDTLQSGDILVVWRLDRLGRSMRHLINLVEDLRTRGIGFRSLNEGAIDTTNATSSQTDHSEDGCDHVPTGTPCVCHA